MITINYNWSGKTILIAEDAESNYLFLAATLRYTKAKLSWAKNGEAAIQFCMESKPDVILMDIQMPVMSGFEATKRIKALYPDIPIIAQTAFAMENDREKILASGCDDYLAKPLRIDSLLETIQKHFNK
jgi:two-component system, cell cycle response regulator DivK